MTVGELQKILSKIKNKGLLVVIEMDDGNLEDICFATSTVIEIENDFTGDREKMLCLNPCYCEIDFDVDEEKDEDENYINSRPELN